jgi:hypothetical protein
MAPLAAGAAAAGVAAVEAAARLLEMDEADEDAAGDPVSVPELNAAALVDSLFAAAMAAMLSATVGVVIEVGVALEMVVDDVAELVIAVEPEPADVAVVTSCPPEVAKTAAAPVIADVGTDDAAAVAGPEFVPSIGTEAAAPVVVPALM